MKKGLRALWSRKAFIGRAWRLSLKMTMRLCKCAITHKIMCVAVACWGIMDIALERSELSELELLQTASYTMITGAMRTTPAKVPEMILDLSTRGMAVECAALMAAYLLPRPDLIGHNRIWAKADKVDCKFSIIKTT